MNKRQKMIIIVATVIIVVMGLFPPWKIVHKTGVSTAGGYSFIAKPPTYEYKSPVLYGKTTDGHDVMLEPVDTVEKTIPGAQIDASRLVIQWIIVGVFAGVAKGLTKNE